MLFYIHMLCETIAVFDVGAYGDIVFFPDIFQCCGPEVQALLKTTEGQALVFFIKSVGSAEQTAGGKGCIPLENQHLLLSMKRLEYKNKKYHQ